MAQSADAASLTAQRERFESLAGRAEHSMTVSPSWYRVKIALLAALGYIAIFGILAGLLAIISLCVWAVASGHAWVLLMKTKLILALPVLGLIILRALWVRIDSPTGYEVFRKDCPRLFDELAELRRTLKAPRIHRILLVNDCNVRVAQIPRLGIFGWHCNYLVIGLSLLFVLSPDQARAVLAHEFGHLSGNHSRFGAWIYRIRLSWFRIVAAFEQADNRASKLLARFFSWYVPYFSAYSFALARANEYEADAVAATLTSRQTVGSALVAVAALAALDRERYWDPLFKRADSEPHTPCRAWSEFVQYARRRSIDNARCETIIAQLLAEDTHYADTHPSLRDRLTALQGGGELSSVQGSLSAEEWLAPALVSRLLADFDRRWLQAHEEEWKQHYAQIQEMKRTLEELEHKEYRLMTQNERWNVIAIKERLDPGFDPLPAYRQYQADYPDDRAADLSIGRLLLFRNDESGLGHLESATGEFRFVIPACQLVGSYAACTGNKTLAEEWTRRAERHYESQMASYRERTMLSINDQLKQADLSQEAVSELRHQLSGIKHLRHAWICEKTVRIVSTQPLYVLAVEASGFTYRSKKKELLRVLTSDIRYPSETLVTLASGDAREIAERVKALGIQVA